jgi:factor associated with neutral sphingomyelinase activation
VCATCADALSRARAGEDYICDWVGFCLPPPGKLEASLSGGGAPLRGRLRLCSASLVFDPDEQRLPVLKFPLAKVESLEREGGGGGGGGGEGCVCLTAGAWVRLKEGGADAPYVHDRSGPAQWRFTLAFAKLAALLVRARARAAAAAGRHAQGAARRARGA